MNKTVRLDDDVAALVEQAGRERSMSVETVVNEALRERLSRAQVLDPKPERFETKTFDLGPCRLENLDNISRVLAFAEGEAFK